MEGTVDVTGLQVSLVRRAAATNPTFPFTGTFAGDVPLCAGCVTLTLCPPGGGLANCGGPGTRYFAATAGSYTFTRADTSSSTGFIRGSLGPTRVVEWDYGSNVAIGGGDCFDLPALSFEGQWP